MLFIEKNEVKCKLENFDFVAYYASCSLWGVKEITITIQAESFISWSKIKKFGLDNTILQNLHWQYDNNSVSTIYEDSDYDYDQWVLIRC